MAKYKTQYGQKADAEKKAREYRKKGHKATVYKVDTKKGQHKRYSLEVDFK